MVSEVFQRIYTIPYPHVNKKLESFSVTFDTPLNG